MTHLCRLTWFDGAGPSVLATRIAAGPTVNCPAVPSSPHPSQAVKVRSDVRASFPDSLFGRVETGTTPPRTILVTCTPGHGAAHPRPEHVRVQSTQLL